jgi:superoxide dismutase, Fe-Mn family
MLMTETNRRDLLAGAAVTVAAAAVAASTAQAAQAQAQPPQGPYQIKPLPFAPGSIKGLSEKIVTSHHQNNYGPCGG